MLWAVVVVVVVVVVGSSVTGSGVVVCSWGSFSELTSGVGVVVVVVGIVGRVVVVVNLKNVMKIGFDCFVLHL